MSAGCCFTCFLALTILGSSVCQPVPDKSSAIVCNEGSLKEIERLISKIPLKVSNAIGVCLQESVPQINGEDREVKCSTGTVFIPKKIHGVIFHTLEFAACGSKVVKSQQVEKLSQTAQSEEERTQEREADEADKAVRRRNKPTEEIVAILSQAAKAPGPSRDELTDKEKKVIEEVQMSGLRLLDQVSKDE